jgi:carbonic anhydrase
VRLPLKATNPMEWEERNSGNGDFVNNVVHTNVHMTIDKIFKDSDIIREMTEANEIEMVEAVYDIKTGKVEFV